MEENHNEPSGSTVLEIDIAVPLARHDFDAADAYIKTPNGAKLAALVPETPYACLVMLARGQLRAFAQCEDTFNCTMATQALLALAEYRLTADTVRARRGYVPFLAMPVSERPVDAYANVIALLAEVGRTREAGPLYNEWRTRSHATGSSFRADSSYAQGAMAAANQQWDRAATAFLTWHKSPIISGKQGDVAY